MRDLNQANPRIDNSRFAMVPRPDVPRSTFVTMHSHKSTFDASYLVPIWVEEVLPADTHSIDLTIFARLNNLIFPLMDHLCLETFGFFVPTRLLWDNWVKMHGERFNPADSISYTVPQCTPAAGGYAVGSLFDYMGLPTIGQLGGASTKNHSSLQLRAYNKIYEDWFRDQNLINGAPQPRGDGPDTPSQFALQRRAKKHDYFTSALPWPLKGGVDVTLPLSGSANIKGLSVLTSVSNTSGNPPASLESGGTSPSGWAAYWQAATGNPLAIRAASVGAGAAPVITADLSTAIGATINAWRLAVQTQRLLERDARGGTRYTELLQNHFGVFPQDARLNRAEYIGGGYSDFQTSAIPQTSASAVTGSTTPLGSLGAQSLVSGKHTFHYSAQEHGYILILANVRADITYQNGLHRQWTRLTRYDFYYPVFSHLGEQAIRNDEIWVQGTGGADSLVFGYQERWAELRHRPGRLSGLMKSTAAGNVDEWHVAENFASLPTLNVTFIEDRTRETLQRCLAGGAAAFGQQIIFDSLFRWKSTRPMPMFSVPGLTDHF